MGKTITVYICIYISLYRPVRICIKIMFTSHHPPQKNKSKTVILKLLTDPYGVFLLISLIVELLYDWTFCYHVVEVDLNIGNCHALKTKPYKGPEFFSCTHDVLQLDPEITFLQIILRPFLTCKVTCL